MIDCLLIDDFYEKRLEKVAAAAYYCLEECCLLANFTTVYCFLTYIQRAVSHQIVKVTYMETAEIRFYKLLKKYNFSEEDAGEFVALQKEMQLENLATKADVADVKSALTWRMFIFWLGQVAATLAIVRYAMP